LTQQLKQTQNREQKVKQKNRNEMETKEFTELTIGHYEIYLFQIDRSIGWETGQCLYETVIVSQMGAIYNIIQGSKRENFATFVRE
jgi:hypothetical protein